MSRLIDANSYLKNFCNRFCGVKECTRTQKKDCCIAISLDAEPTAYDVDKVVERLEEVGQLELKTHGGRCNEKTLALGYAKGVENAIEIVKEEGKINR